ncbi:hypothetical protein LXA47_03830 [Massilia sp. P8910]|uniref:hypothetical protein n=1 Tax=Massilia antarctica TaxID=2765360 RepID=UPI001E3C4D84|nr:hypothetical protein [Massilia antarctica]MCE3602728.1 hypothetical protein [Massilia antarctica]
MLSRFPRVPDGIRTIFTEWAAVSRAVDKELPLQSGNLFRVRWRQSIETIAMLGRNEQTFITIFSHPARIRAKVELMVEVMGGLPASGSTVHVRKDTEKVRQWLAQFH